MLGVVKAKQKSFSSFLIPQHPTTMSDESAPKKQKMAPANPRIIALFDVDGTLTIPRGEITPEMMSFMKSLSEKITVGIVGGSDLPKQEEQLGEGIAKVFPYNFSQNGLVAYKDGELQEVQTISKFLGEDNIKRIVNWTMKYLADIDIPVKVRGAFSFVCSEEVHPVINNLLTTITINCINSRSAVPSSNSAVE